MKVWRPKKGDVVSLLTPRRVVRVGYEFDFEWAVRTTLEEAGVPPSPRVSAAGGKIALAISLLSYRPLCKEVVDSIWESHPAFQQAREAMPGALGAVLCMNAGLNLDGVSRGLVAHEWRRAVVRQFISDRLQAKIKDGNERKIFCEPLRVPDITLPPLCSQPWEVVETRTAVTGKYFPASGDGDCFDGAGLTSQKVHVILHLSYAGRAFGMPSAFEVLRGDTADYTTRRTLEALEAAG
jgi:hypothetical protein